MLSLGAVESGFISKPKAGSFIPVALTSVLVCSTTVCCCRKYKLPDDDCFGKVGTYPRALSQHHPAVVSFNHDQRAWPWRPAALLWLSGGIFTWTFSSPQAQSGLTQSENFLQSFKPINKSLTWATTGSPRIDPRNMERNGHRHYHTRDFPFPFFFSKEKAT